MHNVHVSMFEVRYNQSDFDDINHFLNIRCYLWYDLYVHMNKFNMTFIFVMITIDVHKI